MEGRPTQQDSNTDDGACDRITLLPWWARVFQVCALSITEQWRDTDCQLIDIDSGEVFQTGRVRLEQLYHAGKVRGETLVVTVT